MRSKNDSSDQRYLLLKMPLSNFSEALARAEQQG